MELIPDDQIMKIRELFNKFSTSNENRITIFENIETKKLKNAVSSFGRNRMMDEHTILLCDTTFFRSNKLGLLITNKAIYCKLIELQPIYHIKIENINSVESYSNKNQNRIIFNLKSGEVLDLHLIFINETGAILLTEIIELLMRAVNIENIGNCSGCGAPLKISSDFCEYCGNKIN